MDENEKTYEESESSTEEKNIYIVEQIISHKKRGGKYRYRIRWKDFSPDQDTWEPEENLIGEYCQELLDAYKTKHNISGDLSKSKHYEYVSDDEEGNKWFVDPNANDREIRNLFVHDRRMDDTEKFLSNFQNDVVRLTRSQRKSILPQSQKKEETNEDKPESSRKRASTKSRSSSIVSKNKPKKTKLKKLNTKGKVRRESSSEYDSSDTSEDSLIEQPVKKVEQKPQSSKISPPKKQISTPVSMIGMDPKKAVSVKAPILPAYKALSSFKIPKKTPDQFAPKKLEPVKPKISPKISVEPRKDVSVIENAPAMPQKSTQWQSIPSERNKIYDKDCNLPNTQYVLKASLNIQPSQLTNYLPLFLDPPAISEISQTTFNDAVLTGKMATVRSALRNKSHGLDLDFSDARGKTLLHRLAEQNCDQQHTQDEIIDCLVNAGASMTFIENEFSRTPLHVAIYSRRFCRVRKFVQLGSPINTTDSRGESPLITALKINNVEVARFLLQTGASYQTAFAIKTNLQKSQLKPVYNYQNSIQSWMRKAFQTIIFDVANFKTLSPVFQSPLNETSQLDFMLHNNKLEDTSKIYPILMVALVDSEKMTAISWGECPVESVFVNGNRLEYLQQGNRFFFPLLPFHQQLNTVNVMVDVSRAKYSKRILAAQVFGIDASMGN